MVRCLRGEFSKSHGVLHFVSYVDFAQKLVGFIVFCDASSVVLDAVLMWGVKVVTYVSPQMNPHEKNYPNHDLEFLMFMFLLNL